MPSIAAALACAGDIVIVGRGCAELGASVFNAPAMTADDVGGVTVERLRSATNAAALVFASPLGDTERVGAVSTVETCRGIGVVVLLAESDTAGVAPGAPSRVGSRTMGAS